MTSRYAVVSSLVGDSAMYRVINFFNFKNYTPSSLHIPGGHFGINMSEFDNVFVCRLVAVFFDKYPKKDAGVIYSPYIPGIISK